MIFNGGEGWSIEFGTADCQHGYAILKGGTGQSIGCYSTRAEAEDALKGLDTPKTDILADEVRTTKSPEEYKKENIAKTSIWDGIFVPTGEALSGVNYGILYQDHRYYHPAKATYENDGKPSAGYGNRSSNN